MENCILVDCERNQEVCGLWHCTTSKEKGRIVWCCKEGCEYKFLIVNDVLIVGTINDHSVLYAAWVLRNEPVDDGIQEEAEAIASDQWDNYNRSVTGAGMIGVDGQITGWSSKCFNVQTPHDMRNNIRQEIKRLFDSGALVPK